MSLVGQTLGAYRIEQELGRGGMAITYRASEGPPLNRKVALKVVGRELVARPEFAALFETEAATIARLEQQCIVPVYGYGRTSEATFLVMRYMEGGTLASLTAGPRLKLPEINRLLGQLAGALDFAHSQGVLHLDVKPSNVLLDKQGQFYLADFGVARRLGQRVYDQDDPRWGTPAYMSPEQCQGRWDELDARADVYSMGVMLFELLTGQVPFDRPTTRQVVEQQLHSLPRLPAELPPALQTVLLQALAKDREARFASAGDLAAALTAAAMGLDLQIPAPGRAAGGHVTQVDRHLAQTVPPPPRDETWFCGLCGTALAGRLEGQPCPSCGSTRALQGVSRLRRR